MTTELTGPARVQPKVVRIATGCPGRPLRTSCCNIASNTFAPSKTVTSSELTSGILRLFRCEKILHYGTRNLLWGQVQLWYGPSFLTTAIWALSSDPPVAPTWNDTFLERTGLPDEFMVPSCRGLSSPTRPIASATFSRISEVWLPESSSANVLTLTPSGVATTTGTICSRTAEGTQLTDEVPTKTGAAIFKGGTGGGLFPDGIVTKTGAAPWISGWWYLPQPSMSQRFLHVQSRDWWSADSKQEKHNLFSLPSCALWLTSIARNFSHFSIGC